MTQQTLAQMVRAKYPGAYDDLSDQQLESSVKSKFPGVYDDIPTSAASGAQKTGAGRTERTSGLATLGDFVIGALKGGGETAINLGQMLHKIPGVSSLVDTLYGQEGLSQASFPAARELTQPTNTAQRIGKGVEQIAELVAPVGAVGAASKGVAAGVRSMLPAGRAAPTVARMGVEGAAGAAMSAAQGGDPTAGGIMSAAVPALGAAYRAIPGALKQQASKQVMQALGPTKERFKAMGEKITPQVLSRGLKGSREELQAQAEQMVGQVGKQIDDAIVAYGQRTASTKPVMDALEAAKAPFQVSVSGGKTPVAAAIRSAKNIPLDTRALKQIDSLQEIVGELGTTATVEQLVGVRRAWDKIVSQAGGYQQRAAGAIGVPLADQSEAAVKREGANAIRKLLDAEVPELSAINKEFAFWKSLDDVLSQTLKRTEPQSKGLGQRLAQGAGAIVGGTAGSGVFGTIAGATLGASVAKMLNSAITSPRWALTSAQLKNNLAEALASGKKEKIAGVLGRITAVQASQVGR